MQIITEKMVRRHVTFSGVFESIGRAFAALDRGESAIFDVVRGYGSDPLHYFAIKSGRDGAGPTIGLKAGSYNPANLRRGAPAHTSTIVLIGDDDGEPFAIVQANYLNGLRTGAANALAVHHLARTDATTLAVIGWGSQAVFEVEAVAHVRQIGRVLAAGRSPERGERFAEAVMKRCGLEVELVDAEQAVRQADMVITATPSTTPIIDSGWVKPGTHISAMGADNVGKQELPVELMSRARVFVDYPPQAIIIGETQHIFQAGLLSRDAIDRQTLGALIVGRTEGRRDDEEITVFDSSGLAIQDIAAAHAAIEAVGLSVNDHTMEIAG